MTATSFFRHNRVFSRFLCASILLLAAALGAVTEELTILNTTDIHGHIEGRNSGLLRLATLIERERHAAGSDNVLFIDCGDTIEGSFSGWVSRGELVIDLLNRLRCDVWVPGNHDFDFGQSVLESRIRQFKGATLAANLHSQQLAGAVEKWRMFTLGRAKAKIAVIGMTLPQRYDPAICGDPPPEARAVGEALREIIGEVTQSRPDIIVLAMHVGKYASGYNVYSLLAGFPEIDLVLCGHTHQELPGEKVRNAWLVQSGKHAQMLGRIVIDFDTRDRRIARIRSELLPVGQDTAEHPALKAAIEPAMSEIRRLGAETVGRVRFVDVERHSPELLLGSLAAAAMRFAADDPKPELAVYGSYRHSTKLEPEMTVTRRMLFNWFRFQDRIGIVSFPGNAYELNNIVKELNSWEARGYVSIFSRQKAAARRGSPGTAQTVAFTSYALSGAGNKFPKLRDFSGSPGTTRMLDKRLRDAVEDYLRTHPTVEYRK